MVRVAIGLVLILVIVGYSAFSVITTGQDWGNHKEQAGIDTQNLASGDHAEGRETDDHQDEDQTDSNSDHS